MNKFHTNSIKKYHLALLDGGGLAGEVGGGLAGEVGGGLAGEVGGGLAGEVGRLGLAGDGLVVLDLQGKGWWTCRQRFLAELKFHPGVKGVPQDHKGLLATVEGFIVLGDPHKHPRSCISNLVAGAHVFSSIFLAN